MTALREIGTWWIDKFDDPREELLCLQWLRGRVYGYGRSNDGRLFFYPPLYRGHLVYLLRTEEIQ